MALVFSVNPSQPDPAAIRRAAAAMLAGGIAVFPTETVYGIGVDIRNEVAVRRVYAVKQRGPSLPLMAHCGDETQLQGYVEEWPDTARRLAAAFWPGPLALVLRRGKLVSRAVAGGGATIGIRMVGHPVFRMLAAALGAPVAGTSANRHGSPATSRFGSVDRELLGQVDVALDAGVCGQEVPSTVLDVTVVPPRLLRRGAVSVEAIEVVAGSVAVLDLQ